jgi:hypothetical protein
MYLYGYCENSTGQEAGNTARLGSYDLAYLLAALLALAS